MALQGVGWSVDVMSQPNWIRHRLPSCPDSLPAYLQEEAVPQADRQFKCAIMLLAQLNRLNKKTNCKEKRSILSRARITMTVLNRNASHYARGLPCFVAQSHRKNRAVTPRQTIAHPAIMAISVVIECNGVPATMICLSASLR